MVERSPALRVQLFGHVRASLDGTPFALAAPRRSMPLLAYLLLHRDALVTREFLAFMLWPDESEDGARAKLRATLHDLIRLLPVAPEGHWIILDGTTVRWNPAASTTVDVDEFEAALADPERLEEAVGLYGGDLVESLYDEWILAPRERLRNAYMDALAQLAAQARRRLDFPRAIAYAKRLLEADSLREDVARRLITLRYEAGDRAGALDEYERFERRLREELGIDPMPETIVLREAIVRNAAVAAEGSAGGDTPAPHVVHAAMPFVGRRDEMERLLDGWSRAARGRGGVAFVGGDPGIGKSRLVAEFARAVNERGGRVLTGATGSPETAPYQAIVEAVRSALPLVASLRLEPVWLGVLATLMPELTGRLDGLPTLPPIESEHERARLFGALTRTLHALAEPRPVLLVLEDLHWAEAATVDALSFLARRLALAPVFIVVTYRDDETPLRHPLRRSRHDALLAGNAQSISLRALSLTDVEDLSRDLGESAPRSATALHRASGGNPLLLGQLLESPAVSDEEAGSPSTIDAVIGARVERLSPDARSVAEIAALVGQRFSREIVRDVGGWDESTFTDALDELLDRKIVREATGRGAFDYAFAHQTLRDVVDAGAPPQRSADRHRRIARAFETFHADRADEFAAELARHYELARDAQAAARYHLVAARRAHALVALAEARAHVERGLVLATESRMRVDLLLLSDQLTRLTGDHVARAAAIDDLAALADLLRDADLRCEAALLRVQLMVATEDRAAFEEAVGRMRALAADADPRWRARLLLEEARVFSYQGDLEGLEASGNMVLAIAREIDDEATASGGLMRLSEVHMHRGQLGEATALMELAQASAARASDFAAETECCRASFMLAYHAGDMERCVALAERLLAIGVEIGDRYSEAAAQLRIGIAWLAARREIARTREKFATAIAIYEELGYQAGIASVLHNRSMLENEIGNFAGAIADTERALEMFRALGDNRAIATALGNLGQMRAVAGDVAQACEDAKAARELAHASAYHIQEACAIENLAAAVAASGDLGEAIRLGNEALAHHRNAETANWSGRLLADLAVWYMLSGDLESARARVDEMLAQRVPMATESSQRFYWATARVLRACGEEAMAKRELTRARELVAELTVELSDEERESFEAVAWNREIIAAFDRDDWP